MVSLISKENKMIQMIYSLMIRVQSKDSYSLLVIMCTERMGKQFGQNMSKVLKIVVHFDLLIYFKNVSK